MKYVLVIGDGMADNANEELGGKTPLEFCRIPVMDELAGKGERGSLQTVPVGVEAGSDTAILNILSYDPRRFYSGRSPLEAAGSGVELESGDVSYRCNMVALEDGEMPFEQKKILSHSGGSIEGESSIELLQALLDNEEFAELARENGMVFHPSPSFRHIGVQKGVKIEGLVAIPPHDHLGEVLGDYLPSGCQAAQGLARMMKLANEILDHHPVNEERRKEGKLPANGIWFWAEGSAIELPSFEQKHGKKGLVVSAVPLVKGIGALAGMDYVEVDGATGELDTNYEGKTQAALEALDKGYDFVVVHVEAPDECTHNGDKNGKLQAIEWLDSRCILPLTQGLNEKGEPYRMLVLSDHKTLLSTRGHDGEPVPFFIYDSRKNAENPEGYNETICGEGVFVEEGDQIMARLFEA